MFFKIQPHTRSGIDVNAPSVHSGHSGRCYMTAIEINDVSNYYRALTISDDVSHTLKEDSALSIIKQLWAVKYFPKAFIALMTHTTTGTSIFDTGGV